MLTDRETDRQTGGRTDMTKLIVAFRNSENAPKSALVYVCLTVSFYYLHYSASFAFSLHELSGSLK